MSVLSINKKGYMKKIFVTLVIFIYQNFFLMEYLLGMNSASEILELKNGLHD